MLKIKNVEYDTEDYQGCETCDYGSEYIDEFTITFDNEETKIFEDECKIIGNKFDKEED